MHDHPLTHSQSPLTHPHKHTHTYHAVERYTGPTKDERRGTVSMHSLQKKVRRIQQAFTQLTGLRSKVNDCHGNVMQLQLI